MFAITIIVNIKNFYFTFLLIIYLYANFKVKYLINFDDNSGSWG